MPLFNNNNGLLLDIAIHFLQNIPCALLTSSAELEPTYSISVGSTLSTLGKYMVQTGSALKLECLTMNQDASPCLF